MHKREKNAQAQVNAKDITALRHKTLYKRMMHRLKNDQEDHKMIFYK
jgi:hypothetical protein